jgi:hypothetical protein
VIVVGVDHYGVAVLNELTERYGDLLTGSYDCVDRIVLNAYFPRGHNPGGFRVWWRRWHDDSDEESDNTHLMRMASRFARRVRAWANAHEVPVIDCKRGERMHQLAEEYLATHTVGRGVFLILVARASAAVWEVTRSSSGVIVNLAKKMAFVNHYSFHIMDPQWGHVTIKMSGHPPFGAQVILNGHEYVAAAARSAGIGFTKQGNCFTAVADPAGLAQVADTLSHPATIGRLSQVCDRWIYSACLCFGLDLDEQARSGFTYGYSVHQAEYSRNLIFKVGAQMEKVFDRIVDRTRARLDVPTLRTLFGAKQRPGRNGSSELSLQLAAMIETPRYDLTMFKVHFGLLTLKAYTKGEHVLRFEAITHNTKQLHCGRVLDRFPEIIGKLAGMTGHFTTTTLDCVDAGFLPEDTLDQLPLPSRIGATRIGGIDLNKPRIRSTLAAVLALAAAPGGFTVTDLATKVHTMTGHTDYTTRQAAYDLRKLRGKDLIIKPGRSRRYHLPAQPARTITALLTLREQVISPILAGIRSPRLGRKPTHWTAIDRDYETLRINMQTLFHDLGIITTTTGAAAA